MNSTVIAQGHIDRSSHTISTEGGVDSAKKFGGGRSTSHFDHLMRADKKIDQKAAELSIPQSTLEAPEINWESIHIQGGHANLHAQNMAVETESIDLPLGQFKIDQLHIKGKEKLAFLLASLTGRWWLNGASRSLI